MKLLGIFVPIGSGVEKNLQVGRKPFGFQPPVVKQRGGHHQQRRPVNAFFFFGLQQGQRLNCFAQAHVVGQATAEAVLVQEAQPVVARFLVAAQFAPEVLGRVVGFNFLKISQIFQLAAQDGRRQAIAFQFLHQHQMVLFQANALVLGTGFHQSE